MARDKTDPLVGRIVRVVRPMTDGELAAQAWSMWGVPGTTPTCIEFDDGTVLFPSRDPEGNGPGVLFGVAPSGKGFSLVSQAPPEAPPEPHLKALRRKKAAVK